jgi:hypothetical protein
LADDLRKAQGQASVKRLTQPVQTTVMAMVVSNCFFGRMTLRFGQHRGKRLCEVPDRYLRWLHRGCDSISPWERQQVKDELSRRGQKFVPADEVLHDLEDRITSAVVDDDDIDHGTAALVGDHLMVAFREIREKYEITSETELMLRPQRPPRRWGEENDD